MLCLQTLFSTSEALHIEFVTKSGRVEPTKKPYVHYWELEEESKVMRKGFKAEFHISDKFVDLGKLFPFRSFTSRTSRSLIQLFKR